MIDTAGTLCTAANEMKRSGALRVFAFATHGLFNGPGEAHRGVAHRRGIVSNTVPLRRDITDVTHKIRQISVGKLLEGAIRAIHSGERSPALHARHGRPPLA